VTTKDKDSGCITEDVGPNSIHRMSVWLHLSFLSVKKDITSGISSI